MKRYIYKFLMVIGIVFASSCDLDLQDSPNVLQPEATDPDFMLNGLLIQTGSFFNQATDIGMEITRMENLFGTTWDDAFAATAFDVMWQDGYADIMVESLVLQDVALEKGLFHHRGIAQALQAYAMVTLVDFFGDVPYEEAFDASNFSPEASSGQLIYNEALILLDSAIGNFAKTPLSDADDFIYGGDAALWTTMAKTLQFKIHLQQALVNTSASVTAMNALLDDGDLIDTEEEAFVYPYSTTDADPDSRHPDFAANYSGGATEYMSNYYMDLLYNDKTDVDPRMRYYFYRQSTEEPNDVTLRDCDGTASPPYYGPNDVFCNIGDGYWGRDHLDNSGIPPDNLSRTIYGVYPVGGKYDDDDNVLGAADEGLQGAGIQPILMPAFTEFMKAEAAHSFGVTGGSVDARVAFETGIRSSMSYVSNFSSSVSPVDIEDADVDAYLVDALAQFDGATGDARLGVIVKEYFIALWGNGVDAYNTYRRTGHPNNLQPALRTANPGDFPRSVLYPASYVNRNSAAEQKDGNTVQVFWDNNPANFVD